MSDVRLDLNLVVVIEAVMLERNVTRAAASLAMSQPAVSNALRRARLLVGDRLFLKTADGVEPTARMRAIWPDLHRSLATVRASIMPQSFDPATDATTFRAAITDSLALEGVPALILALRQKAPFARLAFKSHTNAASLDAVERGTLDCAVGMFPALPLGMHVLALGADEHVCVMRTGHPLREGLSLESFVHASHVLVSPSGQDQGVVDGWLSLRGYARPIVAIVNHAEDALRIVAGSDLLACVPSAVLRGRRSSLLAAMGLVGAVLPFETERVLYKLIWHERLHAHPTHAWFRRLVARTCSSDPPVEEVAGPA